MPCIVSIDVEDWFHILDVPSTPALADWDALPSRVERNFHRLLDILARHGRQATCFFLGWIAERFPRLVQEAHAAGHEIASHGYAHELVYKQSRRQFRQDIDKSKNILEDLIGEPVLGYRAPGFSVTEDTQWFFDELFDAGYRHDASVFPIRSGHGGLRASPWDASVIPTRRGSMAECPVTLASLLGKATCFFGGGYLRLFPYPLIRRMMQQVFDDGRPVCVYVHPREIDPDHPRLPMSAVRRFKTYVNLRGTQHKLERILAEHETITHRDYLAGLMQPAEHVHELRRAA